MVIRIALLLIVMSVGVCADEPGGSAATGQFLHQFEIGVRAGRFSSGTVKIGASEWENAASYSLGMFANFPSKSPIVFGMFVEMQDTKTQEGVRLPFYWDSDDLSRSLINIGLTARYVIDAYRQRLHLRPGIAIGYGMLNNFPATYDTRYMTVTYLGEAVWWVNETFGVIGELSLFTAPMGGNELTDVSTGGIVMLRAGLSAQL